MTERVPKRSYRSESRQGRDEEALILSDEMDVDVASEFPGLKVGDKNVQAREEEEIVASELKTFEKAADPVMREADPIMQHEKLFGRLLNPSAR